MTETPHREVAALLDKYRRDLRETRPSDELDARIDLLVAGPRKDISAKARRPLQRMRYWAAAAGISTLSIAAGILIGMNLRRPLAATSLAQEVNLQPEDFSLWPADSVALQIPAEYSAQGKLVAVDRNARGTGERYWINVVVSNDGTIRIERIVPAERTDEITLQNP